MEFDGVDARIELANVTGWPTNYPVTVCGVIRVDTSGTNRVICNAGNNSDAQGYVFYLTTTDQLGWFPVTGGIISSGSITENVWGFFGISHASTTSHRMFFYNYENRSIVLNESSGATTNAIITPTTSARIGDQLQAGSHSLFFDGQIAWLAVYNVDLTADGNFLAMAHLGPFCRATPSLLYTFMEDVQGNTSMTTRDKMGTGNNGTLTNFAFDANDGWRPMSLPGPFWTRRAARVIRPQGAAQPPLTLMGAICM